MRSFIAILIGLLLIVAACAIAHADPMPLPGTDSVPVVQFDSQGRLPGQGDDPTVYATSAPAVSPRLLRRNRRAGDVILVGQALDGITTARILNLGGQELNVAATLPFAAADPSYNGRERTWLIVGAVVMHAGPIGLVVGRVITGLTYRAHLRRVPERVPEAAAAAALLGPAWNALQLRGH